MRGIGPGLVDPSARGAVLPAVGTAAVMVAYWLPNVFVDLETEPPASPSDG